jgi:hypothetical protein
MGVTVVTLKARTLAVPHRVLSPETMAKNAAQGSRTTNLLFAARSLFWADDGRAMSDVMFVQIN